MELQQIVYYAIPYLLALGLAAALVFFGGAIIGRPIVPLAMYLAVFFIFAQSSYGSLELRSNPIYARGSGQLFFPLVFWLLLVAIGWSWLGRKFAATAAHPMPPVLMWLWAWLLLLLAHTVWGLIAGHAAADILSGTGFVNIVWMLPLIVLMIWSARDEKTLAWVARLLVLAALAKSAYGLGRWAFFGGDKSNIYANVGKIDVKLTYFDIADNLVCLLGAAVAVSLLLVHREKARNQLWPLVYSLTAVLALVSITLSYRRTAWGGLILAVLLLLWRMKAKTRVPILLAGLPVLVVGMAYAATKRLGAQRGSTGISSFFFDLTGNVFGAESSRALELRLAWEAFTSSPLVGIGAWGHFAHSNLIAWQDKSAGSFLHSGVLHIAMKAGLVGLILLGGLIWSYVASVRRLPQDMDAMPTALVLAASCALLFMLPDFLLGTPIPQVRTTQLIAFCFGLPLMVSAAMRVRLAPR